MMDALTMDSLEDDVLDEPDNVVARFIRRPMVTICINCALVVFGIMSVVFDWLWVDDMLKAQEGLVFGPPSGQIVGTLIWVATIGTITFSFEIFNAVWKMVRGNVVVHEDINQILSVFLEEVPSVTLNFLLAACREVPVSYYQMVKAGLAMVGAVIRCMKVLVKFLTVRRRTDSKKGLIPLILRVMILFACAYLMAGSMLTWIYTYSVGSGEDSSGIKLPSNLISKSYDSAKYLYKAGIYMSHPWYNDCNDNKKSWNDGSSLNWIQLESLMKLENSEDQFMMVWYHYNDEESAIITQLDEDVNCYVATMPDCTVYPIQNCDIATENYTTSLEFKFESLEYTKTLVFGDIRFKSILMRPDELYCHELSGNGIGYLTTPNETVAQLQYFKSKIHVNDTEMYVQLANSTEMGYYQFPLDLFNVSDVWKTGYNKCAMSGSLTPNHGKNIDIAC